MHRLASVQLYSCSHYLSRKSVTIVIGFLAPPKKGKPLRASSAITQNRPMSIT